MERFKDCILQMPRMDEQTHFAAEDSLSEGSVSRMRCRNKNRRHEVL